MAAMDAQDSTPALQPNAADQQAIEAMDDVLAVHLNDSHWWNHASFVLPLLGAVVFVVIGLLSGTAEATGFGLFLGGITVFMLPVVLMTWRGTPTAIVLTRERATALHSGKALRAVAWADIDRIERFETMGNVRWKLIPREGQHLTVDGEITDVPGLIEHAEELSGVSASS